jgi:hypothetical protein
MPSRQFRVTSRVIGERIVVALEMESLRFGFVDEDVLES